MQWTQSFPQDILSITTTNLLIGVKKVVRLVSRTHILIQVPLLLQPQFRSASFASAYKESRPLFLFKFNLPSQLLPPFTHHPQGFHYCWALPWYKTLPLGDTYVPRTTTPVWTLGSLNGSLWYMAVGTTTRHVDRTPPSFSTHLFQFIDAKEQGDIQKQPVGHSPDKAHLPGLLFFMDFGFMHASLMDYWLPQPGRNREWLNLLKGIKLT
jgi:hypothetical protein